MQTSTIYVELTREENAWVIYNGAYCGLYIVRISGLSYLNEFVYTFENYISRTWYVELQVMLQRLYSLFVVLIFVFFCVRYK